MLLFICPVNEFDALHDIKDGDIVHIFLVILSSDLLWHGTCLVLQEVERIHHVLYYRSSMLSNREHADDSTSQAVVEAESRTRTTFHVERDGLEAAHVEESLILYLCQP